MKLELLACIANVFETVVVRDTWTHHTTGNTPDPGVKVLKLWYGWLVPEQKSLVDLF